MARSFEIHRPPETAYVREVLFALELIDAVTMERVVQGVKVTAVGLSGRPIQNRSGMFVWLKEPIAGFQKLVIDPRVLPYEPMEIPAAQVQRPHHTVHLRPLANYPFTPGLTAIRGSLYETRVPLGAAPAPVAGATVRVEWQDSQSAYQPGTGQSVTNAAGDFVSILRFALNESPHVDNNGMLALRLLARRAGGGAERFQDLNVPLGRAKDAVFAWDELQ